MLKYLLLTRKAGLLLFPLTALAILLSDEYDMFNDNDVARNRIRLYCITPDVDIKAVYDTGLSRFTAQRRGYGWSCES